jgi:hypothetical protein
MRAAGGEPDIAASRVRMRTDDIAVTHALGALKVVID